MSIGTYDDFYSVLGFRESSNNYKVVNTYNYLGKYQMGEAAFVDIGLANLDSNPYDNNYSGGFTGKYGVDSVTEFLNTPAAQDSAIRDYMALQFSYLEPVWKYNGQVLNGITITISGMLAAAHLLGWDAAMAYLESGGDYVPADAFGTKISEYMQLMGDYDTPFVIDNSAAEKVTGGTGADTLSSGGGNDLLVGNGGADSLGGQSGRDKLNGGGGNDSLDGGLGNDALLGGTGKDTLTGGGGADTFIFSALTHSRAGALRDVITDFAAGADKIDFRGLLSSLTDAAGFVGQDAFSGAAGEVRFGVSGSQTIVEVDTNGDKIVDAQVALMGILALQDTDFLV